MSTLTERQKKIIRILIKCNGKASGKLLSKTAGISLRTLLNDMKELKRLKLVEADNTGYKIIIDNQDLQLFTNEESDLKQKILNSLLNTNEALDVDELADDFFVSTSTLRNRLKEIDQSIGENDLSLTYKNNTVAIVGTELNKRLMIRKMIYADFPSNMMSIDNLSVYFHDMDINSLYHIVLSSVKANGYYIQEAYSSSLLLNIIIGLYRISQGIHTLDFDPPDTDSKEYKLAYEVCDRYARHFHKTVSEGDIASITSLFYGQISYTDQVHSTTNYDSIFENKINAILASTFEKYLLAMDYSAYLHNISLHIFDLIKRSQSKNYVTTHIHNTMKQKCPFVYDVAVNFAKQLENEFKIIITDDEIGFLSVHLGFIIENTMDTNQFIDILLVADHYHGIADHIYDTLIERHKDLIRITVMEPTSQAIPKQSVDFVISTVPLEIIGKQIIMISPIFNAIERAQVDEAIARYLQDKKTRRSHIFLTSCFTPSLFFRNELIQTKDEAIHFLSNKMIEFGIVQQDFTDSVFEREKLSPTCFYDAFAIPHALNMDAKKTMIAVLINEQGIQWDQSTIKLCLLIAIKKKDITEFSGVYNTIVHALCDYERLNSLYKCDSSAMFVSTLKQ